MSAGSPLALPRLERFQGVDGRTMVRMEMKRTYSDGTHAIELSALALAEKLAAIVPPPRANTVIYSGVLAANAALRPDVIPRAPTSTDAEKAAREARKLKRRDGPQPSLQAQLALSWADLLQRVFRVDGWECPQCKKPMSLRTVVPPRAPASSTACRTRSRGVGGKTGADRARARRAPGLWARARGCTLAG